MADGAQGTGALSTTQLNFLSRHVGVQEQSDGVSPLDQALKEKILTEAVAPPTGEEEAGDPEKPETPQDPEGPQEQDVPEESGDRKEALEKFARAVEATRTEIAKYVPPAFPKFEDDQIEALRKGCDMCWDAVEGGDKSVSEGRVWLDKINKLIPMLLIANSAANWGTRGDVPKGSKAREAIDEATEELCALRSLEDDPDLYEAVIETQPPEEAADKVEQLLYDIEMVCENALKFLDSLSDKLAKAFKAAKGNAEDPKVKKEDDKMAKAADGAVKAARTKCEPMKKALADLVG